MVDVEVRDDVATFRVRGLHQLWAFRRKIEVPLGRMRAAYRDPLVKRKLKGVHCPGTYIPGFLTAGTFYGPGGKTFWDVADPRNAVVVELDGHDYAKLVVEVRDPEGVVAMLGGTR